MQNPAIADSFRKVALNINGELITDPLTPCISAFDRSYLYGDSLYEVVRTYGGNFVFMEEHLMRLAKSAELCRMRLSQPLSSIRDECEKTLRAFQALPGVGDTEAYCRIVISRGTGKIGFGPENILTGTTFAIIAQPLGEPSAAQWEEGFRYRIVDRIRNDKRAQDPAAKTGNYMNSLMAYLEGAQNGFHDALLLDGQGFLTEGTTFNLFYIRRGIIATAPFSSGILDGITRKTVISLARRAGFEVREVLFPRERLYDADEVFMTSTIKEVFPVVQVDDWKIANGKPGNITRELKKIFHADAVVRAERAAKSIANSSASPNASPKRRAV